jgi:hypothetical protein
MSINTELATMSNDITCFEEERNKIAIIILVIDNYKVVNIFKNSITTLNNRVIRKELIAHLKSIELLKDHKIQYILRFMINKSLEELNSTINLENSYKITPFTSLNNLIFSEPVNNNINENNNINDSFTSVDSLMLIVTK